METGLFDWGVMALRMGNVPTLRLLSPLALLLDCGQRTRDNSSEDLHGRQEKRD
ncbi:MAG: hypothetical protein ACI87E_004647 [Mariniblastus sp.]|jgi:hypothetical protein